MIWGALKRAPFKRVCSSAGRAAVSKAAGRGFESLRTRYGILFERGIKMAVDVNMMEVKKTQQLSKPVNQAAATSETVVKSVQWKNFLGDIKSEFSKISWTSPEELRTYTKIVVAGTFIFGMGIYLMDIIIQTVLSGLNGIMSLIAG